MRRRQHPFCNADVKTNVVGLITDCTLDSGAIARVPGSAAMGGEKQETDSRTCRKRILGLARACFTTWTQTPTWLASSRTALAMVHGSTTMGRECILVSSDGNLQEKGTLPVDKETVTQNVPLEAKGGCELEVKNEPSMLSVSQGYNLCHDDTDPCGFAQMCQKICGSCTETAQPIRHRHHRTRHVLPSQCWLTPSPSNVIAEGDPHVSSLTDDHRPDGEGDRQ